MGKSRIRRTTLVMPKSNYHRAIMDDHNYHSSSSAKTFKGKTGLRRVWNAAGFSIAGYQAAWQNEAAFRQVSLMACIGIALALWLPITWPFRALILMSHFICVVVELLNSAVEAAVDHTSLEIHPLAKRAKDLGSAAQMTSLLGLAAMWTIGLLIG